MANFDGWTKERVDEILAKQGAATNVISNFVKARDRVLSKEETPQQRTQALGRLPAGTMNKTEQKYAARLETLKHAGEILWYAFEPINIRLAANTFYKVDFLVLLSSGAIEAHEVKGTFIREDSLAKIKIAATKLPFQFCIMQYEKGEWNRRDF